MSRVLIIEDEIDTATPVREALALENIDADIAVDGSDGLKKFKEGDYDLVLLDLKLPGVDGEAVLAEIRKTDPFIDVIIYTNYSAFEEIKKLTNMGIQGYVNKGFDADLPELVSLIMNKLSPLSAEDVEKLIKATPEELFENK